MSGERPVVDETLVVSRDGGAWRQWLFPGVLVGLFLLLLVFVYTNFNLGLDFTDEGYCLNAIKAPFLYRGSTTLFGYVYHPLWLITQGDVSLIRALNTTILLVLAAALGVLTSLYRRLPPPFTQAENHVYQALVAMGLALFGLLFFGEWLPTVGYNALCLQGLLVTAAGLTWFLLRDDCQQGPGLSLLVTFSGLCLTFAAKPTSGLFSLLATQAVWLVSRQQTAKLANNLAFLMVYPVLAAGTWAVFPYLRDGLEMAHMMGGSHTSVAFTLYSTLSAWPYLLLSFIFLLSYFLSKENKYLLSSYLAILPLAYSVGTSASYLNHSLGAVVFIGLALLLSFRPIDKPWVLPLICMAALGVVAWHVYGGLLKPYRQPEPVFSQSNIVRMATGGSALRLSASSAAFIQAAQATLGRAGFYPGTPMLDLSGRSPGLLYAVGASAIGQPWMIGGYPGSEQLTLFALQRTPRSVLESAWLLEEPEGDRPLPPTLLSALGLARTRYEAVGEVLAPKGADPSLTGRMIFFRPVR